MQNGKHRLTGIAGQSDKPISDSVDPSISSSTKKSSFFPSTADFFAAGTIGLPFTSAIGFGMWRDVLASSTVFSRLSRARIRAASSLL